MWKPIWPNPMKPISMRSSAFDFALSPKPHGGRG
jgi:hypothetical protein